MNRRQAIATLAGGTAAMALAAGAAFAQVSDDAVRIGVLTDMSSLYSDSTGPGSVLAAEMAVADFGGTVLGKPIEIVSADHQNKADVTAIKVREWFEGGVDVIVDLPGSATAEAAKEVGREMKKITFITGAGASTLSNEGCSPYSVHWNYDTYSNANAVVQPLVAAGNDTWFFITADYSFGHALQADATAAIEKAGGKVLGEVKHPANSSDFSSYVLQAQSSGAKMIGLANTGADALNTLKAMNEMGIMAGGQKAVLMVGDSNVFHSLSLPVSQGIVTVIAAYWDQNDETRAFSARFVEKMGQPPMQTHLGTYTAVLHYLQAVEAAGTDDSDAVMAKVREIPISNILWKEGQVREDGRAIHEMFVWQGKTPEESTADWDVLKLIATVPGADAFRPLADSACPLVKK